MYKRFFELLTASLLCLLFMICLITPGRAAGIWALDLTPQRWTPPPQSGLANSMNLTVDGLHFALAGNTPRHQNTLVWSYDAAGQKLDGYQYCLLTYRANGISRGLNPSQTAALISVKWQDKDGKAVSLPILDISKIWIDGREHTVLIRKPLPQTVSAVNVELTTENSAADVTIKRLEFMDAIPANVGELNIKQGWNVEGFPKSAFKSISLNDQFNDSITQAFDRQITNDGTVYGGEQTLPGGDVTVDGVPFLVGPADKNLVHAKEDKTVPIAKTIAFGMEVPRKYFLPAARNDAITIPINAQGSELYLLLQNESPSTHSNGVVPVPFRWPDIESLTIKLNYADGTDLAFPWSPSDAAFTIQRTLGSYAVPLDITRNLKSITLLNREWNMNISVAAVTINTSPKQLFAAAWQAPAPVKVSAVPALRVIPAYAKRQGDTVILGNTYYEVTADFSNGFALKNLRNRSNPNTAIRLDPESGIELTLGDKTLTGKDFTMSHLEVKGASVTAHLISRDAAIPLSVDINLVATNNQELQTDCTLNYSGSIKAELKFPALKGMTIGNLQDTWLFMPLCGNALTHKTGWYRSYNNQGFAVQFMDSFNPGVGVGVGLMTRNEGTALFQYGSSKETDGVSEYILYDTNDMALEAGEPLKTVTTSLVFHGGDWHQSAGVYKKWLDTWYKPVKAQNKSWWMNSWLIGCLWASKDISLRDLHVPPVYDAQTEKFKIDEAIAADEIYDGAKPDGYHFFKLVHDDVNNLNLWDETAEATYARLGGLKNVQKMVDDFHKKGMFVSFYYVPDRYGLFSDLAKKYDKSQIAARDKNGNYLIWDGYEPGDKDTIAANQSDTWFNYLAENTNKIVRDTNADSIYLDVFPLHAIQYTFENGKPVRTNPNAGTINLLTRMRDLYPAKTAIWTEDQAADIPSQYLDGCISYSGTSTSLILSPRWDEPEETPNLLKPEIDIARYTMPHLKQFCLPQGYVSGWTVMKQMLFNGKGLFGGSWEQWDGDVSKIIGGQIGLLRKYSDCFNSGNPEELVPTLRGDVYANKFPAKNRTLWTIMNASGITIRGNVIAVPHKSNAVYQNAADGKKLSYSVHDGMAYISMKLDPQSVSCILQTVSPAK